MSNPQKRNNSRDGEGGGGCCGGCAGCLVLLTVGAVVACMLFLTPYLRERNWTKEGIRERFYSLKARIETIVEEIVQKLKDSVEHPSHAPENFRDIKEKVKDTAQETKESISGTGTQEPAFSPPPDATEKKTYEEPAVLPGAETPSLESELIED